MSIRLACDICGKDNHQYPEIIFNNGDIVLPIKNYKGEEYNVTVKLAIQSKEDKNTLDQAQGAAVLKGMEDLPKLQEIMNSKPVIKNPNPHICTVCTKISIVDAVQNGNIDPKNNITEEKEIQFAKPQSLDDYLKGADPSTRRSYSNPSPTDTNKLTEALDAMFGELFKDLNINDLIGLDSKTRDPNFDELFKDLNMDDLFNPKKRRPNFDEDSDLDDTTK